MTGKKWENEGDFFLMERHEQKYVQQHHNIEDWILISCYSSGMV